MKISYQATYHLLDRYYSRRSLNHFLEKDISPEVFKASKLFAQKIEDYRYLDVMVSKRAELDKQFIFFTNYKQELPIIIEPNKDLTLLEFALLYLRCGIINIAEFTTVVEAQAQNAQLDSNKEIETFIELTNIEEAVKDAFAKKEAEENEKGGV